MFEIGSSLRQARQRRGLDVVDVERSTRIRAKYLTALEEEQFHLLPGPAYVRGFIRTYANEVGLDAGLLVEEYNDRFAPPEDEPNPFHPISGPSRVRLLARPAAVLTVGFVVFGGIAVWQLGFTTAKRTPIPPAAAAEPPAPANAKPHHATRVVVATPKPATLVVRASRGDCWVLVRAGGPYGRVLYQQTLGAGGTLRFGLRQKLWVRLGAPWNTDVTARGKALGPFSGNTPVSLTAA